MHVPTLLPDELVGGYLSRLAHLNAATSGEAVLNAMYRSPDRPRGGVACPTPFELIAQVAGVDKKLLLCAHSLAPLQMAIQAERDPIQHGDPLNRRFERRLRRDVSDPGLWRCPRCVREDLIFWGFAYSRRSAQLPGVDWCTKHGCLLQRTSSCLGEEATPVALTTAEARYADIMGALFDLRLSIPLTQASIRLRNRGEQLGVRVRRDRAGRTMSNLVTSAMPRRWLQRHRPWLLSGGCISLDNIQTRPVNPFALQDYVLALTALYNTADEALSDFLRPLDAAEQFRVDDLARRRCGHRPAELRVEVELKETARQ